MTAQAVDIQLLADTLKHADITDEKGLVNSMVANGVSALDISHLIFKTYRRGVKFGMDAMTGVIEKEKV